MKDSVAEREQERYIFSLSTDPLPKWMQPPEPGCSEDGSQDSSRSPVWGQSPKHMGHPLLPPQAHQQGTGSEVEELGP